MPYVPHVVKERPKIENIRLEDISGRSIFWRNFRGEGRMNKGIPVNAEGRMNFAINIDDIDLAHKLDEDGWPIEWREPEEEGDSPTAYIKKVNVRFDNEAFPVRVAIVKKDNTGKNVTEFLTQETVGMLDFARIDTASVTLRVWARPFEDGGYTPIIYLSVLFAKLQYDDVDYYNEKYGIDTGSVDE